MTPQFGKYIRTLRTEHGLTQAALAAKLHVTDKAVSKWERDLSIRISACSRELQRYSA